MKKAKSGTMWMGCFTERATGKPYFMGIKERTHAQALLRLRKMGYLCFSVSKPKEIKRVTVRLFKAR